MTYYPPRSTILQNVSPIAQAMFEICATNFFQSLALIFDPSWSSKVKGDNGNRKPVGRTYKCSMRSNLVSVTVFEIFRVKILTFHLLTFIGLTPEPKVTKMGDDVPPTLIYHIRKTSAQSRKRSTRYALPKVFTFWCLGCKLLGQSSPKGEMTCWTLRSTILQNFVALCQPTPDISVTKYPADTHTKNKYVS